MTKNLKIWSMRALVLAMPLASWAVAWDPSGPMANVLKIATWVVNLLFIILAVYFVWGVITYVMAAGDPKKIEQGRQHILWGLIGLGVVAGMWGIGKMLVSFLGFETTEIKPPSIQ